jgi:xylulokinase
MDPDAVGAFIGLNLKHTRAEMIRAVLEGVVMSLRQGLEILIGLEIPVNRIVTSGGASNHPLWRQLQADIFNRPIYRTQTTEASAVGAAILAGVGIGIYPDIPEACRRTVLWKPDTLKPDIENVALYNDSYQTFTRLYPSIKPIMG